MVASVLLALGLGVAATGLTGSDAVAAADGRMLFTSKGCAGCHVGPGMEPGASVGPDLSAITADPPYLRLSIADPDAEIVPGYPAVMPDLDLSDAEIEALVAFLVAGR